MALRKGCVVVVVVAVGVVAGKEAKPINIYLSVYIYRYYIAGVCPLFHACTNI